jgi:hypothetical protein
MLTPWPSPSFNSLAYVTVHGDYATGEPCPDVKWEGLVRKHVWGDVIVGILHIGYPGRKLEYFLAGESNSGQECT